ncbi:MAG TPA: thioredoxin domain-containing protein [Cryomorphaceae bacterium]|nr:thioredoxin domain-containing protein [Cryomorphaceae bacterium]
MPTNALADETSPYLLQHAHNPVNWMPWGEEAFARAKSENKLMIISIGYSSCHWCHVMERETFEDTAAAALMNEHFISVKVDREERPDVDQIYMTAVQLMTRQGGWPLNVVSLPDGRPVWGGTYFPRENWMNALQSIYEIYRDEPEKVLEYARQLHEGIVQSELVNINPNPASFSQEEAQAIFINWQRSLDTMKGGADRAPKFPMPNNYLFLLHFGQQDDNSLALDQVRLTLKRMAYGGIYDQVGGGFARYSTDTDWKVPHFEKMLYDNAQLITLYSQAYRKFKDPMYARIIGETLNWVEREMTGESGEFYSALDADSEGEEGKFYVWKKAELQELIPEKEWNDFASFYNVNQNGYWEKDYYILLRNPGADPMQGEPLKPEAERWQQTLFEAREQRERPGLDDKALTSWNALMLSAYLEAYKVMVHEDPEKAQNYRKKALRNAQWILNNQLKKDGSLYHSYRHGTSSINGLLEDYAFSISAFLKLFEVSFDEQYLKQAEDWTAYIKEHFQDSASGLFYTRSLQDEPLIAKSMETADNVIPASNSVMALNLFYLSHYLDKPAYRKQAEQMLNHVKDRMLQYGESYSNWGRLMLHLTYPYYEVAISGPDAHQKYEELQHAYLPNTLWVASEEESKLPLLENRFNEGNTRIYVCQNKVCQLPVEGPEKALKLIQ